MKPILLDNSSNFVSDLNNNNSDNKASILSPTDISKRKINLSHVLADSERFNTLTPFTNKNTNGSHRAINKRKLK